MFEAPEARNAKAWAIGPGYDVNVVRALKARHMSPLQGEEYFWLSEPGVARETRLPRATIFRAYSARSTPLTAHMPTVLGHLFLMGK
jgi:hypothetical protein